MKIVIVLALSAGVLTAFAARGDEETDRLGSEATSLFRVIMASEPPASRCQFGTDWDHDAVPEYVARRYLGSTLHADLLSPFQSANFENTLDPARRQPTAFCDPTASRVFRDELLDAFERDKSASKVRVEHTAFTFPVFDATYRKAIVIVARSGIERDRLDTSLGQMKPGDIVRHPGFLAEVARIYAKTSDGWKLEKSELIEQS